MKWINGYIIGTFLVIVSLTSAVAISPPDSYNGEKDKIWVQP